MTTAYLNRYGGMKPVDEVKRPDVKEDAAATLSSAFIVWRQMASVVMDNRRMYQSSVDFLQPYKGMLEGLHDASPLVQFRRGLPPSSPSDCFFAAVLNLSGVAVFADDFNDWFSPGYLLPEGKTLIALPGSDTRNLGEGAKGLRPGRRRRLAAYRFGGADHSRRTFFQRPCGNGDFRDRQQGCAAEPVGAGHGR